MAGPEHIFTSNYRGLAPIQHHPKPVQSDRAAAEGSGDLQLKKACSDFESLFIYQLLQEMRKTVSKSGLISEGRSGPMVNSMLDMELSKEMSRQKGIGLAQVLYDQLKNYQTSAEEVGAKLKSTMP